MEKVLERTLLYDFYSEMLTDKQKNFFELHYLNDLSLSEIALEKGITSQAVSNLLQRTESKLKTMENNLGLMEKHIMRQELLKQATDIVVDFRSNITNDKNAIENIDTLMEILEKLSLTD